MSILNVNQIQPVGSGQTVTISAANITASGGNFVGNVTGNATGLSGSPTLSGITSISTTNLTVNGNAYPNAGPLSNRNLIINGAMQVAQRGTSQTTSDYGTVDRFFTSFSGGAVTTTQESLTSGDPYDEGFRNFARLTNTTSATGVSNYRLFVQRIEAQNMANSGWNYSSATSYITLSFWVRSSVSQAFIVRLRSEDGTLQNYPMSTGTLTADTWTKITKTIPGNSNVAFNNDNGNGLRVEFAAFWGTNYTDSGVSLDTWAAYSASTRAPDMTSTWAGTTDATFDVTGVQLEVGTVATPFEHRSYGDELARCIRYYRRLNSDTQSDVYTGYGVGVCNDGTRMIWTTMLSPPMRSHPAISGTTQRVYDGSSNFAVTSFATNRSSTNALWIEPTASGGTMTIGRAVLVGNNNDATGYIELSAEL